MNSLIIYHTLTTILKSVPLSTKLKRVTRLFTLRVQTAWARWVLSHFAAGRPRLLVDDTKLSHHLSITMLGLWVEGGCIPLAWRCSHAKASPKEGQVKLICGLVETVLAAEPRHPIEVLADRGIGTSPDLIKALHALNVRVFLRVQGRSSSAMTRGVKSP